MKMEMTERDKKLLVMLSMFVIIVGIGYWGVFAVLKDIWAMNEEIEEQEEIKAKNDLKLVQVPMLEIDNEDLEEDIVDARKQYYPMMNSAQLDQYITDKILDAGLYAYDLKIWISDKETELKPYQFASNKKDDEESDEDSDSKSDRDVLDSMLGFDDDTEGFIEFEEEPSTGIYTAALEFRLGGDADRLDAFLNELLNTDRKMRVVSYQWKEQHDINYIKAESEQEVGEYVIVTAKTLSVKLEMYMCEE